MDPWTETPQFKAQLAKAKAFLRKNNFTPCYTSFSPVTDADRRREAEERQREEERRLAAEYERSRAVKPLRLVS